MTTIFAHTQKGGKMKLIDADAFRHQMYHEVFEKDGEDQRWDSGCWMRYKLFEKVLKEQPAVDAVEVVRCRDCKHNPNDTWFECPISNLPYKEDRWCWKGERQ